MYGKSNETRDEQSERERTGKANAPRAESERREWCERLKLERTQRWEWDLRGSRPSEPSDERVVWEAGGRANRARRERCERLEAARANRAMRVRCERLKAERTEQWEWGMRGWRPSEPSDESEVWEAEGRVNRTTHHRTWGYTQLLSEW